MTVQDTRIEAARKKEMHSFWNTFLDSNLPVLLCLQAFMQKCQEISFKVLSCFALGLGFEEDFFTKVTSSHLFWHSCLTRHQRAAMMYKYPLSKCLPLSSALCKSMQCDQSFSWAGSCMRCPKSPSQDSPFSHLWALAMPSFLAFYLLLEAKNKFAF